MGFEVALTIIENEIGILPPDSEVSRRQISTNVAKGRPVLVRPP